MDKRKRSGRKKPWISDLLLRCAALLAMSICVLLVLLVPLLTASDAVMRSLRAPAPYHEPEKLETFTLPANSEAPILTQHDYAGWVGLIISGTIDLGGGFYHDAERLCDAGGNCTPYTGLTINGRHLSKMPRRFSHDGYDYMFHNVGDTPRQIAFHLNTENYPEATGALEVEVYYPWHSFGRGGR